MKTPSHYDTHAASTGSSEESGVSRDDRILPEVRFIAAVVILVLAAAVTVLYFMPERTGELFAWKINPQMSAIFLGAGYAGGAYFFIRVTLASKWHTVANIFLPTTVFVWLMLAATILHLDKFLIGTIVFDLWFIIYVITPVLVPFLWFRNHVADPHRLEPGDIAMPRLVRTASAFVGVVTLAIVVLLFVLPQFGTDTLGFWPWQLSPLTARVTAAALALPAFTWLILSREQRWSAWRVPIEMQCIPLILTLVGVARAWGDLQSKQSSHVAICCIGYSIARSQHSSLYSDGKQAANICSFRRHHLILDMSRREIVRAKHTLI